MSHKDILLHERYESPTQETRNFEYDVLEAGKRRIVQQHTNEIKSLMRRSSQDIIDIGQKLIEVKKQLGHGNFRKWLKLEFNWSISTATKFMQVWEQFKCVNFTYLNITASTLYLIAAPSTPRKARVEVLERASSGENISYTEAKKIVSQYRKIKKEDLTQEELQTETLCPKGLPRASQESLAFVDFEDKHIASSIKDIAAISHNQSDATVDKIVIGITNLTTEQLAQVIIKAANNGLDENHLLTIIKASQQALNTRQQYVS